MPKFNIYPKKGRMFSIECQSIKRNEKGFALRGGDQEGFVFFENVAAIILERLVDEKNEIDNILFHVCLKGHSKPARVFAHSCWVATTPHGFDWWLAKVPNLENLYEFWTPGASSYGCRDSIERKTQRNVKFPIPL